MMAKHYDPRQIEWDLTPINASILSRTYWEQAIDRSLKTALQALAVFFTGGVALQSIDWASALVAVGVTVCITLVMSLVLARPVESQMFSIDVVQRAVRTFLATGIGVLIGLENLAAIQWNNVLGLAASAAVLSVISSLLSRPIGIPGTASVLRGADLPHVQGFVPLVAKRPDK